MPAVQPALLASLQANTENIRNICILAHVDHGKTTLSDSLISSNGIISAKLAGRVRYLDNRPDEIQRQITMKSSCISLLFQKTVATNTKNYLINLIDSPGHVDFSSEVSTAVRLCDGGLVLVDVLEGPCAQTKAVIRQAWSEKVKPCLMLNKMDRLINELHLSPQEAYDHIQRVLSDVNLIAGSLFSEEWISQLNKRAAEKLTDTITVDDVADPQTVTDFDVELENQAEEGTYFSPEKGNVCFGSAYDGWAFRIEDFVELYAKKLAIKKEILLKTLWGDYYFNPKTKTIHKKNTTGKMVPMFVQFVLNNIWEVYNAANSDDKTKREKISTALKLTISPKELNSNDSRSVIQSIMSRWLPVPNAVLGMVVQQLPSPIEAQPVRIQKLWQFTVLPPLSDNTEPFNRDEIKSQQKQLHHDISSCNVSGEVVAYVSKVFAVSADAAINIPRVPIPRRDRTQPSASAAPSAPSDTAAPLEPTPVSTEQPKAVIEPPKPETNDNNSKPAAPPVSRGVVSRVHTSTLNEKFIGFARIFSGTIRKGQVIQVLGPRYSPLEPSKHRSEMVVTELYLLIGRSLEPVECVPAGNIFGLGAVEDHIIKTATISSLHNCPSLNTMTFISSPIVRVAVEPENPSEMHKLVEGLKILNQADPSVEIVVQETGEHVIVASGELHLERCLRDLKETFAKIEIRVSPPLVAFRETITNDTSFKFPNLAKQLATEGTKTANKLATIFLRAVALPEPILKFINDNANLIKRIFVQESAELEDNAEIETFRKNFLDAFSEAGEQWKKEIDCLWAFGPRRMGCNLLLNHITGFHDNPNYWTPVSNKMSKGYQPKSSKKSSTKISQITQQLKELQIEGQLNSTSEETEVETVTEEQRLRLIQEYENSIVSGFQLATASGPLCEEPMVGIAFIVEDIQFKEFIDKSKEVKHGPFSGQVISAMKEACRQTFMSHSVRLVEAMYLCDISVSQDVMGKVYSVLGRRRAKILKEEVKESFVSIEAHLPVVESFGISEELLKQTSGAASTQMVFSHWEVLDQDPFFVATTEAELEDIGENLGGVAPNIARQFMDGIRKRKGLKVEEKIVKHADKQRTLKKNK